MNIKDVARVAGFSIATVSRAFRAPEKVNVHTRAQIERVAKQLGYIANSSAQVLRTRRSRVLGVVLPTLLNPVFAECLDGIARAAHASGYSIVPVTTDYQVTSEERTVQTFIAANVDGVLLVVSNPADSLALRLLKSKQIPYVLAYNLHQDHPCVTVDSEAAVADVVGQLADCGHRHIAMVSGHLAQSDRAQQRYRGYLKAMRQLGLQHRDLIEVPFMATSVAQISVQLARSDRPTALFCSNDLLAIRSVRAANDSGLRVPDDLSVVGFDGIELGMDLTPRLTTIQQPNREMGRVCVRLLADSLARGLLPGPEHTQILDYSLRVGESATIADAHMPTPSRRTK
ncbi:substrate-binding domain-containing protein [Alcaligenaceae bacterium]|nr:substrate-binding domain-containing protein [Alcaligenaceae bacterium]